MPRVNTPRTPGLQVLKDTLDQDHASVQKVVHVGWPMTELFRAVVSCQSVKLLPKQTSTGIFRSRPKHSRNLCSIESCSTLIIRPSRIFWLCSAVSVKHDMNSAHDLFCFHVGADSTGEEGCRTRETQPQAGGEEPLCQSGRRGGRVNRSQGAASWLAATWEPEAACSTLDVKRVPRVVQLVPKRI